ncbi:DNA-directed RNA polymerase V subunit 1 [Rosa rugosa]|uniref:DNA-directed RNA polymerase V subunit 1 n=1 Tax=Rosa rugosa TaxID=74645 RepID=UPI002B40D683|nr:DNA-directed RNA polymerase V subunit 1 [Rosa rugosa]
MEEASCSPVLDGELVGIKFGLATHHEICTASMMGCSISHASQLSNPFLGLPLEFGKCESCGTSEPGKCEGHFGYIDLPLPIYHPNHVSELKRLLSFLCLKCLKMKKNKVPSKSVGLAERLLSVCCEDASQVSIAEIKPTDGACSLQLKLPSNKKPPPGFWNFLERYGFRYGDGVKRTLLPREVMQILKRIPEDTRRKLAAKGYNPQDGYILNHIPVPPNCLSVPEISDGVTVMSADPSISMLKKVLRQVEMITSSRSGTANFESEIVEANELQAIVDQYLQVRGTGKASRDIDARFGVTKELNDSSTKAWLEKMRTLFIRKGSGFSSRTVITGDAYRRVNEVGIPYEIAQRITFEEKVNVHNIRRLQELVDSKLCLTYSDGSSTYSLREGSKGHTFLRPGQVVHRRIMDGDLVFVNRPPTTHKHSLQALQVYVHDDHVVKINPLICGPLSADFDGDCIHLFYPQSLAAKAEVMELFSVEKQLLSSHSGKPNLQLATDSLLSLKMMFKKYFFDKAAAQQLAMFVSSSLPQPALLKANSAVPYWTALQILQTALPAHFECSGDRHLVSASEVLKLDCNTSLIPALINDIGTSIFFEKSAEDVLNFFNSMQPLLMENLFSEGFSVGLEDFAMSRESIQEIRKGLKIISPLLYHMRTTYNELVELQLENHIRTVKQPVSNFISNSSALGDLIDSKSDSAMNKVTQQVGFLGRQLYDQGKLYSKTLVEDVSSLYQSKYPSDSVDYPSAEFGLVHSGFVHGLDPVEGMIHSIATREVIVRSSRGLSEPGTLFKNLMATLRDVVICYDGTVRNVCSNSIIQFEYGVKSGSSPQNLFPAGEPVGVLAATAMSNPAYKAVLDSTPSSNSSWDLMKEILLCKVSFKNELIDRRVILYLNDCGCGRNYCREHAAYLVKNQLKKVSLKDTAVEFMIEYQNQRAAGSMEIDSGLVGHVHLNEMLLRELNLGMYEILQKCEETINSFRRKKVGKKMNIGDIFKRTVLSYSECCSFHQSSADNGSGSPCLMFFYQDFNNSELEAISQILADFICPVLLKTVIKGDPRISSANIIWINSESTTWIRSPNKSLKGELALDVVLEKSVVKQSGDAWRIALDCCLPVLHVIDTRRSIPYAIKQVQELLGVSCAFDQAVQRLATAVAMVAKGVLKEHLILLANSMTCAGNFVGFNPGGYKALSRALNIQVPFTEATLFTPKKCFERAAEKCHMDSLSSIVASCSWGKHVAVGTGSRFEILWDTREGGLNEEGGIDVFNFLHMVNAANGEESTTAALGAEIDDLVPEYENGDVSLSPEHNCTSDKPVFEDIVEFPDSFENVPGKSSRDSSLNTASSGGKDWGAVKVGRQDSISAETQVDSTSAWGAKVSTEDAPSAWGTAKTATKEDAPSAWGTKTSTEDAPSAWGTAKTATSPWETNTGREDSTSGWGTSTAREDATTAWGKSNEKKHVEDSKAREDATSCWGTENPQSTWRTSTESENGWSGGGVSKAESTDVQSKKAQEDSTSNGWNAFSGGPTKPQKENAGSGWGMKGFEKKDGNELEQDKSTARHSWGQQKPAGTSQGPWAQQKSPEISKDAWGQQNAATSEGAWGQEKPADTSQGSWGRQKSPEISKGAWQEQKPADANSHSTWGRQKSPDISEGAWGQQKPDTTSQGSWGQQKSPEMSQGTWGRQKSPDISQGTWGRQKSPDISQGAWGQQKPSDTSQPATVNQWDSPSAGDGSAGERQQQWGHNGDANKKRRFEGGRSWGPNAGEWKSKNSRPANADSSVAALYTATRQRLDIFTSEEQHVLSHIEPIMLSIRRIMHQSGYNDGDRLSDEDQSYILENVFTHHPDKDVKMGSGIDYFTVDRHGSFQESRCLFVISTDGRKEDFSYRKCLQNMIKGKHPELAEAFNDKYFSKPRRNPMFGQTPPERTGNEETQ